MMKYFPAIFPSVMALVCVFGMGLITSDCAREENACTAACQWRHSEMRVQFEEFCICRDATVLRRINDRCLYELDTGESDEQEGLPDQERPRDGGHSPE